MTLLARLCVLLASVTFAAALTACGGGGGSAATTGGTLPPSSSTPVPTPIPSPTPATLLLSATALNFLAPGTAYGQTFTASESGYNGTFSESDTCTTNGTGIVGIAFAAQTGPSASYTVTPISAGSCAIIITDASGQRKNVNIIVTTTGIQGQ